MTVLRLKADAERPDPALLRRLANVLETGGVVVVPTETVYGVAARLDRPAAIRRLRTVKRRPDGKPLQVLVADVAQAVRLALEWPPAAVRLAESFWPGPLTVVVPAAAAVPDGVVAPDGTVGLRCPGPPALRQLLELSGPVAASSANLAGEPPATDCDGALAVLSAVDAALDTGPAVGGVPSTVVAITGDGWRILRQGALDETSLRATLEVHGGG